MLTGNERVLIGVPTAEMARYGRFYDYVDMLQKLPRTEKMFSRGQSPARNRNVIIEYALSKDFTHILFLDDDLAIPSDVMFKLINHDKDMVTGFYMMRNYPHRPILFDIAQEDGACAFTELIGQEEGLIPVVASGLGCCLIKTDVFRVMEKPWITLGEYEKDHWNDDISFFNRARAKGFRLYCDLSIKCGHMCTTMVIPSYVNGQWLVTYDTQGTKSVSFPLESVRESVEV